MPVQIMAMLVFALGTNSVHPDADGACGTPGIIPSPYCLSFNLVLVGLSLYMFLCFANTPTAFTLSR
jgi:hypothetical protein